MNYKRKGNKIVSAKKKHINRPSYKAKLEESEARNLELRQSEDYLGKEINEVKKRAYQNTFNLIKDIEARDKLLFNMRHADKFDSKLNLNIEKAVMATNEKYLAGDKYEVKEQSYPAADADLADKLKFETTEADPTNPRHYKSHPSGIECIQVIRHMNFNRGNAIKYIWRAGLKSDEIHDLAKAIWYLRDEIGRLKKEK